MWKNVNYFGLVTLHGVTGLGYLLVILVSVHRIRQNGRHFPNDILDEFIEWKYVNFE